MKEKVELSAALDFISSEAKRNVLDALAVTMHNDGYYVQGNTEATDREWLARWLYENWANQEAQSGRSAWDRIEAEEQAAWLKLAALCIDSLPFFFERISNRYIHMAEMLRDMERTESLRWTQLRADVRKALKS